MSKNVGIQISAKFTHTFDGVDDAEAATDVLDKAGMKYEQDGDTGYRKWRARNGAPLTKAYIPEGTEAFVVENPTIVMIPPKEWDDGAAERRMEELRGKISEYIKQYGYEHYEVEGKLVPAANWTWIE